MKRILNKIVLMAVVCTAINSCKEFAGFIYGQNKDFKNDKFFYLKKFKNKGLDPQKVYFVNSNNLNSGASKFRFLKSLGSNRFYYYYGTVYKHNELRTFKSLENTKNGCRDVIESLVNENLYPFSNTKSTDSLVFDNYSFLNYNTKKLEIKDDIKTVFLVYNHSMGTIFFKDIKETINFINSRPDYDYVVLFSDIFSD